MHLRFIILIKDMSADLNARKSGNRCSEIYASAHIGGSRHCRVCSLIAGGRCLILCQGQSKTSAGHRRKLPFLINHSTDGIGVHTGQHAINNHGPHRHLTLIGFAAGFTINQICKKISVPFFKSHLRNISFCRRICQL